MTAPDSTSDDAFDRYRQLQRYVDWSEQDVANVKRMLPYVEPRFGQLVDDFYDAVGSNAETRRVLTGGSQQMQRLRLALCRWLQELFSGVYDRDYVRRRLRVGWRHVEIGLDQMYTKVALSRLRVGLVRAICECWDGDKGELLALVVSFNKLVDLDAAIIEDAYGREFTRRSQTTERLATIGQVAAGIAHELRNPLNVIKTSIYYLENAKAASPEKKAAHLDRIQRQVTVADNVIAALSDFAALPTPRSEPVALAALLNGVLLDQEPGPQFEVVCDFPEHLPPVLGDVRQLSIVFGNLIRNALEAMPGGGRLEVSAQAKDDFVAVSLRDTGIGISPENLSHITEPLYSTKARGIGLGLAITNAILNKHQGFLRVTSEPDRGSQFVVLLPMAVETAEKHSIAQAGTKP